LVEFSISLLFSLSISAKSAALAVVLFVETDIIKLEEQLDGTASNKGNEIAATFI
jgi:hypothetical protein